ncbi:hypothetical protein TELCIR_01360 [Teladorsagia circumcincta]|uniref:Uncharacterized protein n=1 Tax=Teladorsagia circumcincta TaxID=45464 RepID=A0A2G9V2H4_TELCI|nr:hypothetical protein TELCIR_01360 [Teladorsagia circumcincta]
MKPASTVTTSTTSTKTTTSRQAPTSTTSQSVSTNPNSVSNQNSSSATLTESLSVDPADSMVVSAIRDLRAQAPSSQFYTPVYRPLCHPLSGSLSSTLHRSTRPPTTLELIYRYTRGHYTSEEVSRLEDDRTQDISIPPQERLPLRIAQALTQAINFDTIFSIEHLANRDLFLIDAFLHHSFFTSIRDQFVNEVTIPSESDLDYPPIRSYSLALITNNFKGLHQSVERLKQFSTDLGQNPSWFQSVNILLDKHQELATLIYNVQSRRNSLADLILPHVFNPVDDNRDLVDLLAQYHITYSNEVHLLASATTSTSFAYTYLQQIANAIKYNLNISSEKFSADEAELPTTKQFLGLVTRDHNVDSVVQLLKATTLGSKPQSPQPSTQSVATSTSPSANTVVTAVQLQPSPPTTSAHASSDTAQPSCSKHQSDIEPCDSDDSMSSRISKPCRVCRELGHHPALCPASVHTAHDTGRFGVFFDSMYRIYKSYYNM